MKKIILPLAFFLWGHLASADVTYIPVYITDDLLPALTLDTQVIHQNFKSQGLTWLEGQQCKAAYQKLFNKDRIKMSLYFGYADLEAGNEHTADFAERAWFEDQLTEDCVDAVSVCGFAQAETNPKVYTKKLNVYGHVVELALTLYNSSLTESHIENTGARAADQNLKTAALEKSYIQSLQNDDISFYFGHARYGSGPGFGPIKDFSKAWFRNYTRKPVLKDIRQSLKANQEPAKMIGMINCDAQAHYGYYLNHNAPSSSLLLSRETILSEDALRILFMSVNSLFNLTCETEMKELFRKSITTVYYRQHEGKPTSIDEKTPLLFNFFKKEKVEGDRYWQWVVGNLLSIEHTMSVNDVEKAAGTQPKK